MAIRPVTAITTAILFVVCCMWNAVEGESHHHEHSLLGQAFELPHQPTAIYQGGINNTSVCRWRYKNNHNDKRFPANLVEIICIGRIDNSQEPGSVPTGHFRGGPWSESTLRCKPIYYPIPVMWMSSESATSNFPAQDVGKISWRLGWEKVATGCALVYPHTVDGRLPPTLH